LMCFAHVSLLSRCMSRYCTSFSWGRSRLPICIVGQVCLYRVNVICVDFLWFIFILHFFAQLSIVLMVAQRDWNLGIKDFARFMNSLLWSILAMSTHHSHFKQIAYLTFRKKRLSKW
jgi:hypothetical protein